MDINEKPGDIYYGTSVNNIYYLEGYDYGEEGYLWWKYDPDEEGWELYDIYDSKKDKPRSISDDDKFNSSQAIAAKFNIPTNAANIKNSKNFIDAGNSPNIQRRKPLFLNMGRKTLYWLVML